MAMVRRKRSAAPRRRTAAKRTKSGGWSGHVTRTSNALDLPSRVFASTNPRRIALSLKRSAESSKRRKGTPYQAAMSMLTFYINRAGKILPARQKAVLQRAKQELRKAFGRA